ncbi:DNA_pol3_gamma3 domain-containing protein/DNA_pol3_delta2 domain-containing protein [Cephalotus follicularis]|uniref:DNA_pol3_gamma3 domain-containing protein/DNA_pol3_delta2 domain-containing protein n=1 Tax=Cephalotus follicularis TaxID=3775 RepID=A0A1Q3CF71_CEPFO|nr:DNA_pol3_gamma3 domain-containing protein/DNA_pol3_delta2 domain-containing protein [Cephalotus follicularis]
MTRAVRDRILKDANGDISDHLRNHIHLTNCIHLKNHMHKQSPVLADRSLMRDLVVLQRSRSLRDPSASPSSWHSASVVDLLPKKGDKDSSIREGRRSVGIEHRRHGRRLSGSSPSLVFFGTSKIAPGEIIREKDGVAAISDRSCRSGVRDGRRVWREESSHRSNRDNVLGDTEEPLHDQGGNESILEVVSRNSVSKDRSRQKGKLGQDAQVKTLSEQLNDVLLDSDDVVSSNVHLHERRFRQERTGDQPDTSARGYSGRVNRGKRRKFRGARRTQTGAALRDVGGQNEQSVASNSSAQVSAGPKFHMEEEGEYGDQNVTRAPGNGCGIPWNWSRIHNRGKTFLDMAGRSLSCGLSDSRSRKGGAAAHGRGFSDMLVASDYTSSSTKSDAEALPLLVEASASQESTENPGWANDYSGELGIFADHLLKHDTDSDLASVARSGEQRNLRGNNHRGHQNLTQKYMPRTFRDLVGQNLVSQALSNAVMRRKVGLLYVFYGPHGTGKTSCARIFARALNCQSLEEPKPCGFCNSCISHDTGKSRNIREVGPVSNFDFESIMDLLDNMVISQLQSHYRVFIFDDCGTLSPDCWGAISKVIDRAPRRVVFVLISSTLDVLPHIIISRCQKFFFPKLKDADIIYTLQWIASKEDIEIDKDALKLIASRSDGSLRDAEMTLEQLSLLGQKISVPLVQELVGLISDEKLVDLLDLALSADTVNTVKNLRVIMETGVEPLALMSQLATVITDILAGSYDFTKDRHKRRFFRRKPLSKEDMEKLRQALKTLSEAEKQLRMSNDKLTWLTASLLQLAPDQQYLLPSSSADTSINHSPSALTNVIARDVARKGGEPSEMANSERGFSANVRLENLHAGSSGYTFENAMMKGKSRDRGRHTGAVVVAPQQTSALSADMIRMSGRQVSGKSHEGIDELWLEVLRNIRLNNIKEYLYREGKLISVSFGAAAPTVQLMFSSHLAKANAEKFRGHILQAFESVLGSPVTIEIRCESKKDVSVRSQVLPMLPTARDGSSLMVVDPESNLGNEMPRGFHQMGRSEIVEIPPSPRELKGNEHTDNNAGSIKIGSGSTWAGEAATLHKESTLDSTSKSRKVGEQRPSQSLVRSKVSLAHVIQQAEGQRSGWSKQKAVSIAEKLEQDNLRLEPRSRSLLCWKATRVTRRKLSRLKIRTRRPHSLLKLVSCGKCLCSHSPR